MAGSDESIEHVDVLIIGAGMSGIDAAYRVQTMCPDKSYLILEMRDRIERQIEQRTLMLSGVSHDLRTPLTRMKLALSMSVRLPYCSRP